ncbi:FBD-associated F-box protein At5g22730-like [Trifolium pratense]|uniref:FBD-associated F-box protein At5g22730-like n=1 Tax=Trifolium pratense TaxID=57577 RepID=UPI001E690C87|nr:FBD-associated F-box protein At5g22730-like [Trifolium pratense]
MAENEDIISTLPNSLLTRILSWVPTLDAVQTSVLSKRWRHVWKEILVLDISDESFVDESFAGDKVDEYQQKIDTFTEFSGFVNSVLALRKCATTKMRLLCNRSHYYSHICNNAVNTWIPSIFSSDLQEFEFQIRCVGLSFLIPTTLNLCTSLNSLSLAGTIIIDQNLLRTIHLPMLRSLKLNMETVVDIKIVNQFMSGCPKLETLEGYFHFGDYSNIHIPQTLETVKFNTDPNGIGFLELRFVGLEANKGTLKYVKKGSLNISSETYLATMLDPLFTMFKVMSGVEELKMHTSTTKWLYGRWRLDRHCLSEVLSLHTLHRLELITPLFVSGFFLSVVQQCPVLHDLKIENRQESPYMLWTEPKCLDFPLTQLTHIQIKGCEGSPEEVDFAVFILKNGKVVEEMKLLDIPADKEKSFEKVMQEPRAKTGLCKVILGKLDPSCY